MFGGVHGPLLAQDLLRAWNGDVVKPSATMVAEPCPQPRQRAESQDLAPRPSMQVQREHGPPRQHLTEAWIEDASHCGVALEDGSKSRLDGNADLQVRPSFMQDLNRRCGENRI